MLDSIRSFFSEYISPAKANKSEKKKHALEVAMCAVLFEMATIDGKFSPQERDIIVNILQERFSLTDDEVHQLMELSVQELSESIDLWQFTQCINENFTREQKIQLIEQIWRVVYSDDSLDKYEDYLVHKLQKLLRLSHKELIEAKLKVNSHGDRIE
ncbi:MAG: TerB family tellurite resistance protein [Thermodesulfobacteriota bacterium]|nr:TerB family tellurite resistance protein [Thermodesulfobacteriota bacterium]